MYKSVILSLMASAALTACASTKTPAHQAHMPKDLPQEWRGGGELSMADTRHAFPTPDRSKPYSNNARETSLWSSSPKSLFGDRRASQTGDIVTVVVEIDDEAEMQNTVTQNRQTDQDFSLGAFFGLPEKINGILPSGASLSPAVDMTRGTTSNGNGSVKREEKITLRLAAQVTGVMPNGYLAVAGTQEIMVNNEARYLKVTGLIRTEDISRVNTITYDKMANARVFYGGQGNITDTVRPQRGNTLINKILPF